MTRQGTRKNDSRELSLGDDFGPAVITVNGVTLAIDASGQPTLKTSGDATVIANGNITAYSTKGDVTAHTNGTVQVKPPAPEQAEALASVVKKAYEIGQLVAGKGVFVGTWAPNDRDGNRLGKTFNLYAAPEDIGKPATFNDAVALVTHLKNWHGHDGFNHLKKGVAPDTALFEAIKDGSYQGEWFIPPLDALQTNLYQNRGEFKPDNAFVTASGSGLARWYWSCTERPDDSSVVNIVDFTGGDDVWFHKDSYELSTRPVRAEPAAP